eukprot:scaffold609_cov170-Amphora_coffeaeformis.AAC.44
MKTVSIERSSANLKSITSQAPFRTRIKSDIQARRDITIYRTTSCSPFVLFLFSDFVVCQPGHQIVTFRFSATSKTKDRRDFAPVDPGFKNPASFCHASIRWQAYKNSGVVGKCLHKFSVHKSCSLTRSQFSLGFDCDIRLIGSKELAKEQTKRDLFSSSTMVIAGTAVSRFGRAATFFVIAVWALFFDSVEAQTNPVGTTICGCQPAVYEITLRFNVTCDDENVAGPGIDEVACIPSKETTEDVTDFRPVLVTDIQFLELNSALDTLQQEPRTGAFRDGDVVRYTSVLAVQPFFNETSLPRAFQMVLRGVNEIDQPIQITWVITYANDCGLFPILFEGQQQGWSVFTDLGDPPAFVCPLAASAAPSATPTAPPTSNPTSTPTSNPTSNPTASPTTSPVAAFETSSPTRMEPLTAGPTDAPTDSPTDAPTEESKPTCPPYEPLEPLPPLKGKGKGKGSYSGKGKGTYSGKGKGKGHHMGGKMHMGGGKMYSTSKSSGGKMYSADKSSGGKMYSTSKSSGGKMYSTSKSSGGKMYSTSKSSGGKMYSTSKSSGGKMYSTSKSSGGKMYSADKSSSGKMYSSSSIKSTGKGGTYSLPKKKVPMSAVMYMDKGRARLLSYMEELLFGSTEHDEYWEDEIWDEEEDQEEEEEDQLTSYYPERRTMTYFKDLGLSKLGGKMFGSSTSSSGKGYSGSGKGTDSSSGKGYSGSGKGTDSSSGKGYSGSGKGTDISSGKGTDISSGKGYSNSSGKMYSSSYKKPTYAPTLLDCPEPPVPPTKGKGASSSMSGKGKGGISSGKSSMSGKGGKGGSYEFSSMKSKGKSSSSMSMLSYMGKGASDTMMSYSSKGSSMSSMSYSSKGSSMSSMSYSSKGSSMSMMSYSGKGTSMSYKGGSSPAHPMMKMKRYAGKGKGSA